MKDCVSSSRRIEFWLEERSLCLRLSSLTSEVKLHMIVTGPLHLRINTLSIVDRCHVVLELDIVLPQVTERCDKVDQDRLNVEPKSKRIYSGIRSRPPRAAGRSGTCKCRLDELRLLDRSHELGGKMSAAFVGEEVDVRAVAAPFVIQGGSVLVRDDLIVDCVV